MPPVLGAGDLPAALAVTAATDLPPAIAVAVIAGVVAVATAIVAFLLNRRSSDDTWTLGLIRETQESQKAALDTANERLARQDAQLTHQDEQLARQATLIIELRAHVEQMRAELALALQRHTECEEARTIADGVIRQLREQLGPDSKGPT